ncbi:MAG: hypothetical protein ACREFY_05270 [Acetobacteraceae bacterium]
MNDVVKLLDAPSPPCATPAGTLAHGPTGRAAASRRDWPRPAMDAVARDATVLTAHLDAAKRAALAGRLDLARGLCAAAILHHQPLLAGSAGLFRQAIAALLYSQAFGQLARLLGAVQGRRVRFHPVPPVAGAPLLRAPAGAEEMEDYVLDPAWFAAKDGDRVIRRLTAALAAWPAQCELRDDIHETRHH